MLSYVPGYLRARDLTPSFPIFSVQLREFDSEISVAWGIQSSV